MLDEIRNRQARVPFEPFIIRLNNGRKLLVAGRETVRVRPQHNVLLFSNDKLDAAEDFDASMIVSLEKAPARRRTRRLSA